MAKFKRTDKRCVIPQPLTFRSPDSDTSLRLGSRHKYTPEKARAICKRIMRKESLTSIAKDPRMPCMDTIISWLADPRLADFREMYYFARRVQAEVYIDEIFEIADDTRDDWTEVTDKEGNFLKYVPNNEAIQRSRVRIDTRKWYAGQMVPRIYGKRLDVQHDVTGDLKELLESASNKDTGLPTKVVNE